MYHVTVLRTQLFHAMAEFMLETNYPSQTDNSSSINSVLRRIMKQNSSEADSSVSSS